MCTYVIERTKTAIYLFPTVRLLHMDPFIPVANLSINRKYLTGRNRGDGLSITDKFLKRVLIQFLTNITENCTVAGEFGDTSIERLR